MPPRIANVSRFLSTASVAASLSVLVASRALAGGPPSGTPAPGPGQPATAAAPVYDRYLLGEKAIQKSGQAALDSGRRLLVNFGTNDCAPCRTVNDAIYERPFVKGFMEQFVPVFVDVSPGSKNRALLDRYGIDPSKGFPAIVLSDETLRVAEATKAGELVAVAGKGKEAVQAWILKRFKVEEGK